MMNFGEAKIVGVDADATLQLSLGKNISLLFDAGYSFQYAVDVTDSSSKNYCHQLPYTPMHTGKFVVSFLSDYVNLSWLITAVGERYMLPQNSERNRMDGYVEHSLSVNREFMLGSCGLLLCGEVLNVGDCRYEVIRYYPMPGISWRLSARLSF
jgi:outer membrane receptor protein involved in Fe transport